MMGLKDASGRVEIVTNVDMFDCFRLQPRTPLEREKELSEGPLYRIITSFSMRDRAVAKVADLKRLHNNKCRVETVNVKKELDMLAAGEFKVKVDGEWVEDYGE